MLKVSIIRFEITRWHASTNLEFALTRAIARNVSFETLYGGQFVINLVDSTKLPC